MEAKKLPPNVKGQRRRLRRAELERQLNRTAKNGGSLGAGRFAQSCRPQWTNPPRRSPPGFCLSGGLITPLGNLTKKQRWRVPHRRFRSTGTGRKPRVSLRRGFFLLTCLDAQGDQLRIRVIGATSATSDTPWGRKVRRKRRTKCCDGTLGKSFRPRPGRNSTDS